MHITSKKPHALFSQICLLLCLLCLATAAGAGMGRSITVRFPAFSLSPGERISGMKFKVSEGRVSVGCCLNNWTCDRGEKETHCYALNERYAMGISGMLPEIIISRIPEGGGNPSIEASVEFIDNSGREYSRDFRQDELVIK